MGRYISFKLLVSLTIFLIISTTLFASETRELKTVLLLHSYHPGLSWTDDITSSIKQTFENSGQAVTLHVEYLDSKRRREPEYLNKYLDELMIFKLGHTTFDLVIVSDNDAFKFALKHRDDLFLDKPIVFCGVNGFDSSQIQDIANITGVAETPDLSATIQLIQKLHPDTKELIVVGTTKDPTGLRNFEHFRRIEPSFQGLHFKYLNDLIMEDLIVQLKELKPGQVVFTSPTIKDKAGRFYDFASATQLLSKACLVPIYGGWDFILGHGIIGGKLIAGASQGAGVARMALDIFNGTDPATISVISTIGSRYMFDYNELKKHKIDLDILPEPHIIIKEPTSFYTVNKNIFWVSLGTILLFALLSIFLVLQILLRKKSERNLMVSEARFKDIALSTGDFIWEVDKRGVYQYCSKKVFKILGYTAEEMLNKAPYDLMPPEQAKIAKNFLREHIADKKAFQDLENWNIHKNGDLVCLLTSGVPIISADGSFVGYRGVDKDITIRKQAEQILQVSEHRFRSLFENTEVSIWDEDLSEVCKVLDKLRLDGVSDLRHYLKNNIQAAWDMVALVKVTRVNRATLRLFGAKSQEEMINNIDKTFGSNAIEVFIDELCAIWDNQSSFRSNITYLTLAGKELKAIIFFQIPETEEGYKSIPVCIIDITELEQTEIALITSQNRFEAITNQSVDGITVADTAGNYTFVNPAFCEMTGYSEKELLNMTVFDMKAEHQDKSSFEKTKTSKESVPVQVALKRKNGTEFISEVVGKVVEINKKECVLGIVRDITERKQAEEVLRAREETINLLLNSTAEGICGVDVNGLCTFCNQSALNLLEYKEQELIGKSLHDLIAHTGKDGSSLPSEECVIKKVISNNKPVYINDSILWRSDNSWFNVEYRALPIIQDERTVGAVLTFIDVTEKKKLLEQQLRSSQLVSLGELAAGMAHEINNPIGGVINYAQVLLNKYTEESSDRDILNRIIKEGNRIVTIVRNLLSFSYQDRDDMAVLTIEGILEEPMQMTSHQMNRDGIYLDVDITDNLPSIYGNAQRLGQVILNLISNARYALNEKYPKADPDKILRISAQQEYSNDKKCLQLTIWDQGCGISKKHLERVFNPFFTTKVAGTGTGLGLSISHDILIEHGATVNVESVVGDFTKFVIEFPAIEETT